MKREGRTNTIFTAVIGIAAGACGTTSIAAKGTAANDEEPDEAEVAEVSEAQALRAQGPAGLAKVLARYDAAPEGEARDELGLLVDQVAGQRYATVSRLYWYTDLDEARKAAADLDRPILSLRMLGRLDEDLSCANSRLFRTVLYANAEVSRFLSDSFVLHWSSERLVPRVTVDYGDGRVVETTIAGNSAHYVLDAEGRPIDVVPGLYGPAAFIATLEGSLAVATELDGLDDGERLKRLATYHREAMASLSRRYAGGGLGPAGAIVYSPGGTDIASAEMRTVSKAAIEMPVLRSVQIGKPLLDLSATMDLSAQLAPRATHKTVLDEQSRGLIARLAPSDWARTPRPLRAERLEQLLLMLQVRIDADTVLSELAIRYQIHHWFTVARSAPAFESLNKRVYSELFLTPANDPWLGIATPGVFTGLPGDGHRRMAPQAQGIASSN